MINYSENKTSSILIPFIQSLYNEEADISELAKRYRNQRRLEFYEQMH